MKEPFLSDDAFLADVEAVGDDDRTVYLWWLGQSGFLVQHSPERLLLDPYLSDSLTRKYAGTEKPHVRMTRRVVDPARLPDVDVVTSTHSHTDHLDAETLVPILDKNPDARLLVSRANQAFAAGRVGHPGQVLSVDEHHAYVGPSFGISVVPAAHDRIERDENGSLRCIGFIIRTGRCTIYHSGDTVVYDGIAELLRPHGIDIAILPINGKVGNMSGTDAARLAKAVGARIVIPCHYDMFEFNTATPDEFVAECERLGQPYRVLRQGERFSSSELEMHGR